MTREEAVKILNTVLCFGKCDCSKEEIKECLKMAIKALERKSCEDCISRKDAIACCRNEWEEEVADRIEALPPVTPQPKTVLYSGDGYADGYMVYDMAECPKCGYEYEDGDKDWGLKFCPNCGQSLNWESEDKEWQIRNIN